MKTRNQFVQLVDQDLALACVVDPSETAAVDFFLRGLQEAAKTAERAERRAARVAAAARR